MVDDIRECDYWWFGQLYSVLADFADDPENTISRLGRISIQDDLANHLDHFRTCILEKYPKAVDLEVMRVVTEINEILSRYSRGGESSDEWFWTNRGFMTHFDWDKIRKLARAHLVH